MKRHEDEPVTAHALVDIHRVHTLLRLLACYKHLHLLFIIYYLQVLEFEFYSTFSCPLEDIEESLAAGES